MVSIISGGKNTNRESLFIERVKLSAEKGENVLVIVPDQFSFEYDRKLYNAMGAKLFNSIRTAGFNRLAEQIANEYGSIHGENASDNAKIILMYKAIKEFKSKGNVKYYKKSLDKGSFITQLNKLISQFRESGITPDSLQLAAERLEGSVSLKLFDIASLYRLYMRELENAGMKDSLSAVAESVMLAEKNNFFFNTKVFVTAFDNFTYDEKRMLELCVKQGIGLVVSLLCDSESVNSFHGHPFAVTVKTEQELVDIAKNHNKQIEQIIADKACYKSEDMQFLSHNLFNLNSQNYSCKDDGVKLYSATDLYEETEFICAEICRLVREEKYKYSDIVVTVRDINSCSAVFEGIFERYELPYFIDAQNKVVASAIVHYLNELFRTVLTKEYKTDNILKYIKSPLFDMTNIKISNLEEYCLQWNVDGDMWKSDFTAGDSKSGKRLENINKCRAEIIEPLEQFKKACVDATAGQISNAFYELLDNVRLSEMTYSVVARASTSDNESQLELARGLKQLWNSALSAVKAIYEYLEEDKMSLRQYYELYKLMLSQMTVSNPPQKLDCIRITDAGHSRTDDVKVVFSAEVNDGIFPAPVKSNGLISENEKNLLSSTENIFISANAMRDFQNEKLASYSALCTPTDKLYVMYSQSDLLGNEKRPSILVKELKRILKVNETEVHTLPLEFFTTSYKTAYCKYVEHLRDNSQSTADLYDTIMASPFYFDKLCHLKSINAKSPFSLSVPVAKECFFENEITAVSPSKLEEYYTCPFKYFCDSTLKLRTVNTVKLDGLNKGNIIHDMLEKIVSRGINNNEVSILRLKDNEIKQFIHEEFLSYYNEKLGGNFGKNATFEFLFSKLEESAFYIVKYVQAELNNTGFKPILAEYEFKADNDHESLVLELKDGKKIVLVGKIDRADIYDNGTEKFLRIIDYKTGEIKLSLSRLYNGLNLQMFVYLSSLLETPNEINPKLDLKQAGVMYIQLKPSRKLINEEDYPEEDVAEKAEQKKKNEFSTQFQIVDENEVLQGFETDTTEKNLVGKTQSSCRKNYTLVTDNFFTGVRKYAMEKVRNFGNNLLDGNIDARPLSDGCTYCNYSGICGRAYPENAVNPDDKEYGEKLKAEIEEIMEGECTDEQC